MAKKKTINFNTYVEQDLTKTNINWGAVSKNLSDSLIKIDTERKAKQAEIDKNTIDTETTLTTLEDYDNQQLGELALSMSQESAEFLRVQNDLFKRGLISQTDFAQAKQRVLSDWKQFSTASKQWNTDYAEYAKRLNDGTASSLEEWLNTQNAAFGNLQNVTGYVNPQTGRLSLVQVDPDTGLPSDDPGKHVSMNVINNRLKTKYDAIDTTKLVKGKVDFLGTLLREKLGPNQQVYGEKGWGTMKDNPDFQLRMREQARALMNPRTIAVIAGQINEGEFTYNPKEISPESQTVLMEINNIGSPVLAKNAANKETIEQMVEDRLYADMMLQLDEEYSVEKGFEISTDLAEERVRGDIASKAYRDELAGKEQRLRERKLELDKEVAEGNMTAQKQATILARDKYELDVLKYETNNELVNAQVDKIYADIDLSGRKQDLAELTGDRNYKIALMNETYKSKLLKEKEKEGVVPFMYPDPNKTGIFDGVEQTANDFVKEFFDREGVYQERMLLLANKDRSKEFIGKYVKGMLDDNVYNQLAEAGGFDVQFERNDKSNKEPGLNTKGQFIITIGGEEYSYPPKKASQADIAKLQKEAPNLTIEEVEKQINDASGYNEYKKSFDARTEKTDDEFTVGSINIDKFLKHLNKFVLDPATTAAIALQEPPVANEVNYIETINKSGRGNAIFEIED